MQRVLPRLLALSLVGCGASALGVRDGAAHVEERASVATTLRMVDGQARLVVPGTLGQARVLWAIDTGAGNHSVTRGEAQRQSLLASTAPSGLTIEGDGALSAGPVTRPVAVGVFPDERTTPSSIVAREAPALEEAGIAGWLSPQRLAPDGGGVEIDLASGRLVALGANAVAHARAATSRGGADLETWHGDASGKLRTVQALVDGARLTLMVDTGTPVTALYADTDAGVRAALRATRHFVSEGGSTEAALVPRATVQVAGLSTAMRLVVLPRSGPWLKGIDGLLGLDVLRGCSIVLDARGGAMRCEAPSTEMDTAPTLAKPVTLPPPRPLPRDPPALPAGAIARLGCETVREADVAVWALGRGVAPSEARDTFLRERVFAHFVTADGSTVSSVISREQVDRAVELVRQRNALDEASFEKVLAERHFTLAGYRATVTEQLLETWITMRVYPPAEIPHDDEAAMSARIDGLAARMRERLARVPLARHDGQCQEVWPSFFVDAIVVRGLSPADQRAVQLIVGRYLHGRRLSIDETGVLPAGLVAALQVAFAGRGLRVRGTPRQEGAVLFVDVTLERADVRSR